MGLDHVMILNMEHDIERYWAMLGGLDTLGFPVFSDVIIRHINHNGLDYKDTKSVHEAAIADGFEEFESFRSRNRQSAAWLWSYRCALRKISKMRNKNVLLLIDDFIPMHGWTRDRLERIILDLEANLDRHSDKFRIIQLSDPHNLEYQTRDTPVVTSVLSEELAGNTDYAVIINARGARLLLKMFAKYPEELPLVIYRRLKKLGDTDPKMRKGMYRTFYEICRMLCDGGFPSQLDLTEDEPWEIE